MNPSPRTSRQDRCPGALEVHHADDGNLARVRVPGGALRAEQLRLLTDAAAHLGDGRLELTSRGNVQLRGLAEGAQIELAVRLRGAGLLPSDSHERVRNIVSSAATGRDGAGHLDVHALVDELDRRLCADPALAQLSGRFLFTVDDGRRDVSGLDGDVGLLGVDANTVALLLTGTDTGLRGRPDHAVTLALAAAHAFVSVRAAQASMAWRLAELGPAGRAACAERIGAGLDRDASRDTGYRRMWISETLVPPADATYRPALGGLAQRDGRVAIGAAVPLGRLGADQAETLAVVAEAGSGELRITPWRTVYLPDLPSDTVDGTMAALRHAGFVLDPAAPLAGVSACAGRPGCARSLADVRGDALRAHAAAATAAVLPVHWSGCARDCGRPADRHVRVRAVDRVRAVGLGYEASLGYEVGLGYEVSLDGVVWSTVDNPADLANVVTAVRCSR